eukprot:TRINITY_DN2820_c0_g1_i1.p1 TRINITY_DN2820_c0_g1~~TRINITY_DN2820_c0_g1_i1.p1  ORF type:complete len:479 (-),score=105.77 TRINITY_DN2820_c0_g1_i1:2-1438(-)
MEPPDYTRPYKELPHYYTDGVPQRFMGLSTIIGGAALGIIGTAMGTVPIATVPMTAACSYLYYHSAEERKKGHDRLKPAVQMSASASMLSLIGSNVWLSRFFDQIRPYNIRYFNNHAGRIATRIVASALPLASLAWEVSSFSHLGQRAHLNFGFAASADHTPNLRDTTAFVKTGKEAYKDWIAEREKIASIHRPIFFGTPETGFYNKGMNGQLGDEIDAIVNYFAPYTAETQYENDDREDATDPDLDFSRAHVEMNRIFGPLNNEWEQSAYDQLVKSNRHFRNFTKDWNWSNLWKRYLPWTTNSPSEPVQDIFSIMPEGYEDLSINSTYHHNTMLYGISGVYPFELVINPYSYHEMYAALVSDWAKNANTKAMWHHPDRVQLVGSDIHMWDLVGRTEAWMTWEHPQQDWGAKASDYKKPRDWNTIIKEGQNTEFRDMMYDDAVEGPPVADVDEVWQEDATNRIIAGTVKTEQDKTNWL